jgi:hypothetical protein
MRDEMLEGLILTGIAQPPMHRLHGLAFAIVEQTVDVLTRRVSLQLSAETRAEAIQILTQAPQERPCEPGGHAGSLRDAR